MCGIVGYVGRRGAADVLLAGLEKLEYRGYDSAGVAITCGEETHITRAVGNLAALRQAMANRWAEQVAVPIRRGPGPAPLSVGIAHTRWATHGRVTEANAHPHSDTNGRIHLVLNGIVENHVALRAELVSSGCHLRSDTDAEAVVQLVGLLYDGDLAKACKPRMHNWKATTRSR